MDYGQISSQRFPKMTSQNDLGRFVIQAPFMLHYCDNCLIPSVYLAIFWWYLCNIVAFIYQNDHHNMKMVTLPQSKVINLLSYWKQKKKTYWDSFRTQLSSSIAWLPINHTRFQKYGSAVLSRIKPSMFLSPTTIK